jgi:hypothetical protein
MSPELFVAIIGGLAAVVGFVTLLMRRLPKRIKQATYTQKWRAIQKLCADRATWPDAIILSDDSLDDVLKKRRITGKTMGERMVNAQKKFSNNDTLWNAHKLASHLRSVEGQNITLKELDVKQALTAFRQAMRDMKAL